jgi:hypothetical protein
LESPEIEWTNVQRSHGVRAVCISGNPRTSRGAAHNFWRRANQGHKECDVPQRTVQSLHRRDRPMSRVRVTKGAHAMSDKPARDTKADLRAVLVDIDGTLLDSNDAHART